MTSANESGTAPDDTLVDVDLAVDHVGDEVDLILDAESQGTTRASTILSLAAGDAGEAVILRRGDVTAEDIQATAELAVEWPMLTTHISNCRHAFPPPVAKSISPGTPDS